MYKNRRNRGKINTLIVPVSFYYHCTNNIQADEILIKVNVYCWKYPKPDIEKALAYDPRAIRKLVDSAKMKKNSENWKAHMRK